MMSVILLNIGNEVVRILIDVIAYLNEIRASSRLLKILLWPVVYALTFAKVMINYVAYGCWKFYNHSMPYNIVTVRNHIFSAIPMSTYCFNKRGFALLFAEMIFIFYLLSVPLRKPALIFPYVLLKILLSSMAFVMMTPSQRVPFWFVAAIFTYYETEAGIKIIKIWGYGIDFYHGHFYNHWAKHYRYRSITPNRIAGTEFCIHFYVLIKLLVLNDYFCYSANKFNHRIAQPHTPTMGSFFFTEGSTVFDVCCLLSIFGIFFCAMLTHGRCGFSFSGRGGVSLAPLPSILVHFIFITTAMLKVKLANLLKSLSVKTDNLYVAGFLPLNAVYPTPKSSNYNYSFIKAVRAFGPVIFMMTHVQAQPSNNSFSTVDVSSIVGNPAIDSTIRASSYDYLIALIEQDTVSSLRYGILFLLALSSLGVYSIILAGWSSNSKYAFIGALRSAAQMISYEVAISLIILPIVIFCGSLDLSMITYMQQITSWLCWPLLPIALLFLIAMLAETNRTPFDLPEAEAELVAGYNVDYSSLPFALFFLGEYCNMILISTLFCLLFLSGGLNSLGIPSALMLSVKAAVTWIFFVLVRATLPRYRYDQLMDIGWKVFLPVSGSFLLFVFGILVAFDALPVTNELPAQFWVARV
jgi:NADH:ubiquinone oxidoreductase subunit H